MKSIIKRIKRRWTVLNGVEFPVNRMIGKSLVAANKLPHREILELYVRHGRDGFDITDTEYYNKIVNFSGDMSENFGSLPASLDIKPTWWLMPWASLPKKSVVQSPQLMDQRARKNIHKLFDLHDSILRNGYAASKGGAISGFMLEHPDYGLVFNHIDGHHRLAVLDFLQGANEKKSVIIDVIKLLKRESLTEEPAYQDGIARRYFSEKDAFSLFDHVFSQLPKR